MPLLNECSKALPPESLPQRDNVDESSVTKTITNTFESDWLESGHIASHVRGSLWSRMSWVGRCRCGDPETLAMRLAGAGLVLVGMLLFVAGL
jgi:hypothetical protein